MATRSDGVFIHQDGDFELRLINGEVIGFIPNDGVDQELRYGSPERAKRIWPGLAEEIDAAVVWFSYIGNNRGTPLRDKHCSVGVAGRR